MSDNEYEAGKLNWKHANSPGDIVAFLVVSEPAETYEKAWDAVSGGY